MTVAAGPFDQLLVDSHDVLLLDLDGVVYTGHRAVPGAVPTLLDALHRGVRLMFVTNNASRSSRVVAEQLVGLGLPVGADDVLTSADAAAEHLAAMLPPGAPVLVVGGPGLVDATLRRGLRPVESAADGPAAVVQGFGPDVGWRALAEAAYALETGVPWVATNRDLTVPTERGVAPGNGSFVRALEEATGRAPVTIGKPEPALFRAAVQRSGAVRPLVVGDRLDTDVLGARRAGLPVMLVLTGVTTVDDVLLAAVDRRPDCVAADLTGLLATDPPVPVVAGSSGSSWSVGRWSARVTGGELMVSGTGEPIDAVRCAAAAAWAASDAGHRPAVATAADLLTGWLGRQH